MTEPKYNIWPVDQVAFVPRTDFLQSLTGVQAPQPRPLEDMIRSSGSRDIGGLRELADYYIHFRNKGARLPAFGRWVTSMFAKDEKYQKQLAAAGKLEDNTSQLKFSCDLVDILRCADSNHFHSCFRYSPALNGKTTDANNVAQWGNMPKHIAERTPGIGIIGIDDTQGKYRGRAWVHHIQVGDAKVDAVMVGLLSGTITHAQIKTFFASKGVKLYGLLDGYGAVHTADTIKGQFVGAFGDLKVHHDVDTRNGERTFGLR